MVMRKLTRQQLFTCHACSSQWPHYFLMGLQAGLKPCSAQQGEPGQNGSHMGRLQNSAFLKHTKWREFNGISKTVFSRPTPAQRVHFGAHRASPGPPVAPLGQIGLAKGDNCAQRGGAQGAPEGAWQGVVADITRCQA